MKKFQNAAVPAKKEAFIMPRFWLERSAQAVISGDVNYEPNVVSMTFSAGIEKRAFTAEAMGVVYMSSRPRGLLYRHNASLGPQNKNPMLVMEREAAKRALRLLRSQKKLELTAKIDVQDRGEYESYNMRAGWTVRVEEQRIRLSNKINNFKKNA